MIANNVAILAMALYLSSAKIDSAARRAENKASEPHDNYIAGPDGTSDVHAEVIRPGADRFRTFQRPSYSSVSASDILGYS